MTPNQAPECPFCGFEADKSDALLKHIEKNHPDAGPSSPPTSEDDADKENKPHLSPPRTSSSRNTSKRPTKEGLKPSSSSMRPRNKRDPPSTSSSSSSRKPKSSSETRTRQSAVAAWREIFSGHRSKDTNNVSSSSRKRVRHKTKHTESSRKSQSPSPEGSVTSSAARLGKSELGRHVNEKQMPGWLATLLEKEKGVCNEGIISVLEQLLRKCPTTRHAYLCSPCVEHISKLTREGSFCGYRNIQMLLSYLINSGAKGSELFGDTIPSIPNIQDLIEDAWDSGFNVQGRVETGGIKGTRKYIGTSEAHAMFSSLQIPCPVQAFKDKDRTRAKNLLFKAIETYFRQGAGQDNDKVNATALPPVYFQFRGHSMTIIGFERSNDGSSHLLVFDPSYRDSSLVRGWVGKTVRHPESKVDNVLSHYRRGTKYLRKYNEFEVLYLTDSAPPQDIDP